MQLSNFILTGLLACLMVLPAAGQLKLGAIGGLNISNASGEDSDGVQLDFSSRTVFGAGILVDIPAGKNNSIRIEALFLKKATDFDVDSDDPAAGTAGADLAYLEIPVMFKVDLGTARVRPYLLGGAAVGFNLSSEIDFSLAGLNEVVDTKEVTNSTEFSLNLGGGVSIPAGSAAIVLEGRYALGLSDIIKDGGIRAFGEELTTDNVDVKTRGLLIMGGITFPIGG